MSQRVHEALEHVFARTNTTGWFIERGPDGLYVIAREFLFSGRRGWVRLDASGLMTGDKLGASRVRLKTIERAVDLMNVAHGGMQFNKTLVDENGVVLEGRLILAKWLKE